MYAALGRVPQRFRDTAICERIHRHIDGLTGVLDQRDVNIFKVSGAK
jgi:hypothetical protein